VRFRCGSQKILTTTHLQEASNTAPILIAQIVCQRYESSIHQTIKKRHKQTKVQYSSYFEGSLSFFIVECLCVIPCAILLLLLKYKDLQLLQVPETKLVYRTHTQVFVRLYHDFCLYLWFEKKIHLAFSPKLFP
jgi:hypothetical protein